MARRANLIVTEADHDLVVYDERTSHLHTVPASIALVWRQCDGMATVDQIAIATGMSPEQTRSALKQLGETGLIEGEPVVDDQGSNRRAFMKKAALGAAIVSVTAPMAASAASVAPAGQCWWLDSGSVVWVEAAWAPVYEACRDLDECFEDGACYKWTVGQNDPHGW